MAQKAKSKGGKTGKSTRSAKRSRSRRPAAKAARKAAPPRAAAPGSRIPTTVSGKQQFLDTFARETATTLKVLRAFPHSHADFRPHMMAKSARELAWTFVIEQYLLTKAFRNELTMGAGVPPAPNDLQTIITQFESDHTALVALMRTVSEDDFHTTVQFPTGPGKMGDWSKLAFAWFILSDQIHHRGQYSVYLRMAGGKVPSIYGPSADEPWR